MTTSFQLDDNLTDRLNALAAARGRSPDAILHDALTEYLDRAGHRAEKKYPQHNPVGGIITPV